MAANAITVPPYYGVPVPANSSLYVGDLEAWVDETRLFTIFSQVAPVISVRICRDKFSTASLGYGYVNFANPRDAAMAKNALNFTQINGKVIRIMFSQRDPIRRKSGQANVFIKNLDSSIDSKMLHDTFAAFGTILSCKVALDANGQSKGYGYVQFDRDEDAQKAIKTLNGMLMNGKQVYISNFVRKQEREDGVFSTDVYANNLPENTTNEDVKKLTSTRVLPPPPVAPPPSTGKLQPPPMVAPPPSTGIAPPPVVAMPYNEVFQQQQCYMPVFRPSNFSMVPNFQPELGHIAHCQGTRQMGPVNYGVNPASMVIPFPPPSQMQPVMLPPPRNYHP